LAKAAFRPAFGGTITYPYNPVTHLETRIEAASKEAQPITLDQECKVISRIKLAQRMNVNLSGLRVQIGDTIITLLGIVATAFPGDLIGAGSRLGFWPSEVPLYISAKLSSGESLDPGDVLDLSPLATIQPATWIAEWRKRNQ